MSDDGRKGNSCGRRRGRQGGEGVIPSLAVITILTGRRPSIKGAPEERDSSSIISALHSSTPLHVQHPASSSHTCGLILPACRLAYGPVSVSIQTRLRPDNIKPA